MSPRSETQQHSEVSNEALLGLGLSFLVASLAGRLIGGTAIYLQFDPERFGFTFVEEFPFIAAVGLTPIIALVIRKQPVWRALVGGQLFMVFAVVSLFVEERPTAAPLSLAFSTVGNQIVAAAFLIAAWRARPTVTALLAGVFVLPGSLYIALSTEIFTDGGRERGVLLGTSLVLLFVGLAAAYLVSMGEAEQEPSDEPGFPTGDIIGMSLMLTGLAYFSGAERAFSGQWSGPALVAIVVGGVMIGAGRQNRESPAPIPQVDRALLVFFSTTAVLSSWASLARWVPVDFDVSFEQSINLERAMSAVLALTLIPIVMFFASADRRFLAIGTLALASAGLVVLVFRFPDLEAGIVDLASFTMLSEWGSLVVIGVAVALGIRQTDNATLEFSVIFFLGVYTIIEQLALDLGFELVVADLFAAERSGDGRVDGATDNIRLFVIATTIALFALSAWWVARPGLTTNKHSADYEDESLFT